MREDGKVHAARFFNTLGRKLEPLAPLAPGRVGIYTCGPTVYNHVHIGNLPSVTGALPSSRDASYGGRRLE